ncbi:MAG: Ni/Fe hydrogenase subunit alpha [Gammaproteobacteria bacterium]
MTRKTIEVDYLARVEGEGAMHVVIDDGAVTACELRIFEPPRFFEAFLRGRDHAEAPDITARICGICPIAYQMSAVHAMEDIFGVRVEGPLRALRRLIYCGEWIESHVLHIYMLHAPDFLGYASAIEMARDHPELVRQGLRLKKIGNDLMTLVGGREIHPINVRVGGFYRVPRRRELETLRADLEWGVAAAEATVRWAATLDFPAFERDYEFVALRHPHEYPFNEGRLVSSAGLDIAVADFDRHFEEIHVPHSTSLHARLRARGSYFVGPLARYNLNFDRLSPRVQAAARAAGVAGGCRNPFQSIVVRALEVLHAYEEALAIIDAYEEPAQAAVDYAVRAGTGHGCTEAPRGICYHRYDVDEAGLITDAVIVPPTSQNQPTIEDDLRHFVAAHVDADDARLQWLCEQAIRNYDPCISCSCHFLDLTVERR